MFVGEVEQHKRRQRSWIVGTVVGPHQQKGWLVFYFLVPLLPCLPYRLVRPLFLVPLSPCRELEMAKPEELWRCDLGEVISMLEEAVVVLGVDFNFLYQTAARKAPTEDRIKIG